VSIASQVNILQNDQPNHSMKTLFGWITKKA